jgi:hypothetical protein
MLIKMKSKIANVTRLTNEVVLDLNFEGQLQDSKLVDAKKATMTARLTLKPVVADQFKLGTTITVLLSDEDEEVT